jgi:hypothetical protein
MFGNGVIGPFLIIYLHNVRRSHPDINLWRSECGSFGALRMLLACSSQALAGHNSRRKRAMSSWRIVRKSRVIPAYDMTKNDGDIPNPRPDLEAE